MSSPVSYFQQLLANAGNEVQGAGSRLLMNPELARKQAILDRLDELKVAGETTANQMRDQQYQDAVLKAKIERAQMLAGGDTGRELVGPPNPDPVAAAEEDAQTHTPMVKAEDLGMPNDPTMAASLASGARQNAILKSVMERMGTEQTAATLGLTQARTEAERYVASGDKTQKPQTIDPSEVPLLRTIGVNVVPGQKVSQDKYDRWMKLVDTRMGASTKAEFRVPTAAEQLFGSSGRPSVGGGAGNAGSAGGGGGGNPPAVKSSGLEPYLDYSATGTPFINVSQFSKPVQNEVLARAAHAGIPTVNQKEADAISDVASVREMMDQIEAGIRLLPTGPANRMVKGPGNLAAQYLQTNPELSSWNANRVAAIRQIRAIAGASQRINRVEVELAVANDIPTVTDTQSTARDKMRRLRGFMQATEDALLNKKTRGAVTPGTQGEVTDEPGGDWDQGAASRSVAGVSQDGLTPAQRAALKEAGIIQ